MCNTGIWQPWVWTVLLGVWVRGGSPCRKTWREVRYLFSPPSASSWTGPISIILGKLRLIQHMYFSLLCEGDYNNNNVALTIISRFIFLIRKLCLHLLEDKLIICYFLGRKSHSEQMEFCHWNGLVLPKQIPSLLSESLWFAHKGALKVREVLKHAIFLWLGS